MTSWTWSLCSQVSSVMSQPILRQLYWKTTWRELESSSEFGQWLAAQQCREGIYVGASKLHLGTVSAASEWTTSKICITHAVKLIKRYICRCQCYKIVFLNKQRKRFQDLLRHVVGIIKKDAVVSKLVPKVDRLSQLSSSFAARCHSCLW